MQVGSTAGITLYEKSRVIEINDTAAGVELITSSGHSVKTKHAIIATNACVPQFAPWLASALRAERGQMAVTEPF
eukprot:SAG31_NODE_36934_length_309_cov_0.685714_1_plen_74_part_01